METPSAARPHPRWVPALLVASLIGSVLAFGVSAASSESSTTDTMCWDEYHASTIDLRSSNWATQDDRIQILVPQGLDPETCTAGDGCFHGSARTETNLRRIFVPHGMAPTTACDDWSPAKAVREPSSQLAAVELRSDPGNAVVDGPATTRTPLIPIAVAETAPMPPTTVGIPSGGNGFTENFDNNEGLDRFRTGVYHRDDVLVAVTEWEGDHDLTCGDPSTTRTIERNNPDDVFYVCREHLMTSVGDTAGYSVGFFSPKVIFESERSVSWDANVTDLGTRQWWEVAILPLDAADTVAIGWLAPSPSGLDKYPDDAVVIGTGPFGGDFHVTSAGRSVQPLSNTICVVDAEACSSKMIRRTFTVTDNEDGTITVQALGESTTLSGSFPDGGFKVVFKDHNYTPNKDNSPVGYTWHWDTIAIR